MDFQRLYEEHFPFVWKSLRRLGVREVDAADAAQEVFLVAYRKLDEFEGRSRMTTWLFGICLRVARDRGRRAHHRREVFEDDEGWIERAEGASDVAEEAERREAAVLLERILDGLDFEQRAVFSLFELEGLAGEEIAELLQLPLGTVYSRLRLARESFQRAVARLQARERFAMSPGASP
jgi:RNA polymerase sigma-70 factor (ECF subfamily)